MLPRGLAVAFQEVTRNETQLFVHSCTLAPPHYIPLVAARLQLPAPSVLPAPPPSLPPPIHTQLIKLLYFILPGMGPTKG